MLVRILLNAKARVDTKVQTTEEIGPTSLMGAAEYHLATSVRLLLERGASVTDVDSRNETALMYSVLRRSSRYSTDFETVDLLVRANSPINAQSTSGKTVLMMVAKENACEQ